MRLERPSCYPHVMFRGRRILCPACGELMRSVALPLRGGGDAEVEICNRCGGVFLEFFDGEPGELSRSLLAHDGHEAALPRAPPAAVACPDCGVPMAELRYLDVGPRVSRCDACMAVFATRQQLRELADFRPPEQPPEPEPSLLGRLRAFFFVGHPGNPPRR